LNQHFAWKTRFLG